MNNFDHKQFTDGTHETKIFMNNLKKEGGVYMLLL